MNYEFCIITVCKLCFEYHEITALCLKVFLFHFRCFRDEDLRADRQPEFTQLDMELAFTPLDDMLKLNEDMIRHVCSNVTGV